VKLNDVIRWELGVGKKRFKDLFIKKHDYITNILKNFRYSKDALQILGNTQCSGHRPVK